MIKLFTKKSREKGFTLIELLVVIAIIGVLASIVMASLNTARKKSRDARRLTDIKQIQLALELYFDGQGSKYPQASATCDATTAYGLQLLAADNYIPQVPRDPLGAATANCYKYSTKTGDTAPSTYHLGATLEETTNAAFSGDKDADTSTTDTNGFVGTDPLYDVTP